MKQLIRLERDVMRKLFLVMAALALMLVLSACLGGDDDPQVQVSTPRPTPRITITPRPTSTLESDALTNATSESGDVGFVLNPDCAFPAGWLGYVVVSGDTLGTIAERINSTAAIIQQNNCLDDETILLGQRLYLPSLPAGVAPIAPTSSTNIIVTSSAPVNCTTPTGWQAYTVVAGDTLGGLADSINSTVAILQSGNCLANSEVIFVGQILFLPSLPANAPTTGPTSIATRPTNCTNIPANWQTYTVVAGDTLGIIAGRVGSDITTLQTTNCLANADSIFVGQVLYVPPTAGVTAPTAAPTFTPRVAATNTNIPQGGNPPSLSQQTITIQPTFQDSSNRLITLQQELSLEIGTLFDADRVIYYAGTIENDPSPVQVGVDNDPFDGTRITYVMNDFDTELYFYAVAENEFGSVSTFQTHVVYDPTYVSASGKPNIFPFLGFDSILYTLEVGSSVNITWQNAPTSATRVEFYLTGTNQTPIIIGTDGNPANGSRITWEIPPQTQGKISARAIFSNGSTIESESVSVVSEN